jgi:hypothetical protein
MHKNMKVERQAPEQQATKDMAVTKLCTGNKVTELRNIGAFACRIKCNKTRA